MRSGRLRVTSATWRRGLEISTNDMGFPQGSITAGFRSDARGGTARGAERVASGSAPTLLDWLAVSSLARGLLDARHRVAREERLHGRQLAREALELGTGADAGTNAHDLHGAVHAALVDLQELGRNPGDPLGDADDLRFELLGRELSLIHI